MIARHRYGRRSAFSLTELLVFIGILAVLIGLLLPGIQRVRAAADSVSCANQLRQLNLALFAYRDHNGALPAGTGIVDKSEPLPFINWHARILPFLEQSALWDQIRLAYRTNRDFSVIPPHVHRATIVKIFICPADDGAARLGQTPRGGPVAFTTYLGIAGRDGIQCDGVLFLGSKVTIPMIQDGLSYTLSIGERPPSADGRFAWWYAGIGQTNNGNADATLGVREYHTSVHENDRRCFVGPYHFGPGVDSNQCDAFHFWSHHVGGAQFAFCDGSVRFFAYPADPILPALATRAGNEPAQMPD